MGKGVLDVGDAKPYFAAIIFTLALILICSRNFKWMPIGRAATALVGGTLMIYFGIVPAEEIGQVVNWDTIILLMSMMMLCTYMERANVWNVASSILMYRCRSTVEFMIRVCVVCAAMSAVLTNDTVCVTVTPIIIQACKTANLPLFPFLMSIATSANIGSASLPVGNPQNMIIATASGIPFTTFFKVSVVSSVVGVAINTILLYFYFRNDLLLNPLTNLNNNQELSNNSIELNIINNDTVNELPPSSSPSSSPSPSLPSSTSNNNNIILTTPNNNNNVLSDNDEDDEDLKDLIPNDQLTMSPRYHHSISLKSKISTKLLQIIKWIDRYKAGIVSLLILIGFFVGLHMGFTVLFGVAILVLMERRDVGDVIRAIDWELLVFFSGLFILVDGFDRQFSSYAWKVLEPWTPLTPNVLRIFIFTIIVIVCCNVLGNVPLVLALSPRLLAESAPPFTWLLLAFVSTVAGNFTLVGSVANLIVAEKSKHDHLIGFRDYLKFGAPSSLIVIAIGTPLVVLLGQT